MTHSIPTSKFYWLSLFFKGVAMGAADIVPGVSGGTIAFISGIYERLLNALKTLNPINFKILFTEGGDKFWKIIDGRFLATLFSGIIVSILSFAKIIHYFLELFPIIIWAFFFGLVLASIICLIRQIRTWHWQEITSISTGTIVSFSLSFFQPTQFPDEWWMIMIAGSIAICAMILPGISGSLILTLMGMYNFFIKALNELNLTLLVSFSGGCLIGLLIFSHLLSFLLTRYFSIILAILTGFLIGSLNILWPWKQIIETVRDPYGESIFLIQRNLSPWMYQEITNNSGYLLIAAFISCVGFFIVLCLDYVTTKY